MKILSTLDLTQNQIINIVLDKRSTAPASPVKGQIYFNDVSNAVLYYNGTVWVDWSSGVQSVTNAAGGGTTIGGTATNPTVAINVDSTTVEISGNIIRLKDAGVSTAKLATDSVTTIKVTDKNITFAKIQDIPTMTIIGRTAAGTGVSSGIAIINDNTFATAAATNLATSSSIKAYVDATVANIGILQGSVDASAVTIFPSSGATKKGDYWYVTVAGTIQGIVLNIGDVMIANKAAASTTNPNDWIFLETNRDLATTSIIGLVQLATNAETQTGTDASKVVTPAALTARTATETRTGIAALATNSEATTGTDDTKIITPLKLKAVLNAMVGGYAVDMGNGVATSFVITHNLNTKDVTTAVFAVATGEKVYTDIQHTSVNTITVSFTGVPTTAQYRVVIKK